MTERVNLDALNTVRAGEQGYELELKTPAGHLVPGHVRVRGYDSETWQRMLDEQQRKRLARGAMGKTPTVEEMNADSLEAAAALVMAWTCPFNLDGKAFEYTPQNALTLLKRFPWIREQVERAAGVRANFLPGSVPS